MIVHATVRCDATEKPHGTSRLSWIIKNASPREDWVAPKQANKNRCINNGVSEVQAQTHACTSTHTHTPEFGADVPVRDVTVSKNP